MTSYVSGSSGSGSLTQLIATGALDAYITANATFTFWKVRFNKHTNYAMEPIGQPFNTSVSFGSSSQISLNRNGDLCYYQYLVVDLPGITAIEAPADGAMGLGPQNQFPYAEQPCAPCAEVDRAIMEEFADDGYTEADSVTKATMLKTAKDRWNRWNYGGCSTLECGEEPEDCPSTLCPETGGVWAYWVNAIGQFLVQSARIVIGGSVIDQVGSDFMYVWEEMSGKSGRRLMEMIGKRYYRSQLLIDSRSRRTLYIPLPFWFCQHSGQALPLASLQFHGVQVHIDFAPLRQCIVVSGPNVVVRNCSTGSPITSNDLSAFLETTYVFLEKAERDRFSNSTFESLIVQHQAFSMQATNSQVRIPLNMNHPIIALYWMVRRQCNERVNNWFNYAGIDNKDPVISASLFLNNQARFSLKPGSYFRLVQPYQHHSNIPDCFVYCFSFALHCEDHSPSGSCNFSRIDAIELLLNLQPGLSKEQVTIMVFARNFNIIRYKEGLCGLAYAN